MRRVSIDDVVECVTLQYIKEEGWSEASHAVQDALDSNQRNQSEENNMTYTESDILGLRERVYSDSDLTEQESNDLCELYERARDEFVRYHDGEVPSEVVEAAGDYHASYSARQDATSLALDIRGSVARDTTHESAEDWYDSYGWDGDGLISYDQASGNDLADPVDPEDAHHLPRAREIAEAADDIESRLDEAVAAWERGDYSTAVNVLIEARSVETDHGDSPATDALAEQLLGEDLWQAIRR